MTLPFTVHATPRYERLSNKLFKNHRDFKDAEQSAFHSTSRKGFADEEAD